ncbi:MAG: 6,7-dimethyl-8-ribityllumazine synthase, partial [Bacteroidales bacterium]
MGEKKKNLSKLLPFELFSVEKLRIGIVVSEWNDNITNSLKEGAYQSLIEHGIEKQNITMCSVPGSFELPSGAVMM